jgi:hypothetical protein
MTKIALASSGRKGTFLVLTSLEKNPNVFCNEQLYSAPPNERNPFIRGLDNYTVAEICFSHEKLQLPETTSIIFPCSPTMQETGKGFWDYVDEHPEIKIIHLRRRNGLRWLLSRTVAGKTKTWSSKYPRNTPEPKITIDPEIAKRQIWWDQKAEADCVNRYKNRPNLEVFYEDLCKEQSLWLNKIQEFMEVPVKDIFPRTRKQATRPLQEGLDNYEQFVEEWKGHEYEAFLYD